MEEPAEELPDLGPIDLDGDPWQHILATADELAALETSTARLQAVRLRIQAVRGIQEAMPAAPLGLIIYDPDDPDWRDPKLDLIQPGRPRADVQALILDCLRLLRLVRVHGTPRAKAEAGALEPRVRALRMIASTRRRSYLMMPREQEDGDGYRPGMTDVAVAVARKVAEERGESLGTVLLLPRKEPVP